MRAINLLPPESFQKQAGRRRVGGLILLGIAYLAVLAVVTTLLGGRVADIESRTELQRATNDGYQTQIAELASMEELLSEYTAQRATLDTILARDVSWGRVLNDLSRVIPDRTWLTSFSGTTNLALETPGVGSIQMTGVAFDFPDVSAWLRSLDADTFPAGEGTWVSTIIDALEGEIEVLNYTSQTTLTAAADAQRRADRIPEVNP
jgi:type IV pilus assembly protein PilN